MTHWGCYVVGIAEPIDSGHGAWGIDFTHDGQEHRYYGGYLGKKDTNREHFTNYHAMMQAARIMAHISQPNEELTINSTSKHVVAVLTRQEDEKWDDYKPLIRRFHGVLKGRKVSVNVVGRDIAAKADYEARNAMFEAIHKWPTKDGFQATVPNSSTGKKPEIKKSSLDDFMGGT